MDRDRDIKNSEPDKNDFTRKEALQEIAKKAASLSLPFIAAGAFTEKANAQYRKLEIVRILNIMLKMEFMLQELYLIAVTSNDLVPSPYSHPISLIKRHHHQHIIRLKYRIHRLKTTATEATPYKFNFNTNDLNPKNDFDDFLQIAQVLEDASASIYKKYTTKLREFDISDKLQRILLRTHTTEARHGAYIRLIRAERGVEGLTPWISSTANNAVQPPMQNIYMNEDNTEQHKIQVPFITSVSLPVVQEAWDEPGEIEAINRLFNLFDARI